MKERILSVITALSPLLPDGLQQKKKCIGDAVDHVFHPESVSSS